MTKDLSIAQDRADVTASLDVFTSAAKGLVPASGGSGTTKFLREDGTFATPAGGGGGTPGGTSGQIQYNNGGALGGVSEVEASLGRLRLLTTTDLTAAAAGGVILGAVTKAARTMPAFIAQEGGARALQANLSAGRFIYVMPQMNNTSFTVFGVATPTATGTATAVTLGTADIYGYEAKVEALVTVAATTAVAGFRNNDRLVTVGGPAAGVGGFAFTTRGGPATGVATATSRFFMGLANSTVAPTDVEPSSITSIVGIGYDAADTNLQIMHNDATGTATKVDLGASFPVPTTDRSAWYELALYSPKGTTQSVNWTVTNLITGATASGTITTDMPAASAGLCPRIWSSAGGTSSVIGVAWGGWGMDTLR